MMGNCGANAWQGIAAVKELEESAMGEVNRRRVMGFFSVMILILCSAVARRLEAGQEVPAQLKPPEGQALVAVAHAKGFQVYTCKDDGKGYNWTLKGPEAELFDKAGKKVGRHFAGPTWEWSDKSQVTGKMMTSSPSPDTDSIAWLLLMATGHSGEGMLANVTNIQRLNTKGGKAPAGGCGAAHAGQETRAAYEADYYFYGK
jgi:hypothetical protein